MAPRIYASLSKYIEQFEISYPMIFNTSKLQQFYKLYCCNVGLNIITPIFRSKNKIKHVFHRKALK
jgi:hypothetical protein